MIAPDNTCPDMDTLIRYAEQKLTLEGMADTRAHLERCPFCHATVEDYWTQPEAPRFAAERVWGSAVLVAWLDVPTAGLERLERRVQLERGFLVAHPDRPEGLASFDVGTGSVAGQGLPVDPLRLRSVLETLEEAAQAGAPLEGARVALAVGRGEAGPALLGQAVDRVLAASQANLERGVWLDEGLEPFLMGQQRRRVVAATGGWHRLEGPSPEPRPVAIRAAAVPLPSRPEGRRPGFVESAFRRRPFLGPAVPLFRHLRGPARVWWLVALLVLGVLSLLVLRHCGLWYCGSGDGASSTQGTGRSEGENGPLETAVWTEWSRP